MKAKKRKKYPGPWRLRETVFGGHYDIRASSNGPGGLDIRGIERRLYHQKIGPGRGDYIVKREEAHTASLNTIMMKLKLSEYEYNLIVLVKSGLSVIDEIFDRYASAENIRKFEDSERRAQEYAEKKIHKLNQKRVKGLQFSRRLEV